MKTIGILQTGFLEGEMAERHGQFPEMFKNLLGIDAFKYRTYAVAQNEFPVHETECDGWIVTGSKHGAYEDHAWIPPLEILIRKLKESSRPTIGICFGHQIMAQALGGTVEKSDKGWGAGQQEYLRKDTGKTVRLLAFHQDQITQQPPKSEVTHTSEFCEFAGLRYSPTCFSLQPHPEFTKDLTRDLVDMRRGNVMPENVAIKVLEILDQENDRDEFASFIRDLLNS
ncbi:MAG: type 1 glutamine amidotransferase [Sneathiella sp.]